VSTATSAAVADAINDGTTTIAPSQNAVFDALALKASIASPTFTGTVSGITSTMVGLTNVDNTSDADKPVSDKTQTELNLKASIASPTFTGTVAIPTLIAGSNTYPTTSGSVNQVLTSDGSGTLAWSTPASSGATNINGLSDALVESSSIYLGKDPSGTTDNANNNVSVGISALNFITTGNNNVAVGFQSLYANTGGYSNTAIGDNVMRFNIDGFRNTAIGTHSLYKNTAGQNNVSNGGYSLHNNTTGSNSSAFGYKALYRSTGSGNTGLGYQAGDVITTGTNNVIIGKDADPSDDSAINQIVIGYNATGAGDDTVQLGNTSVNNVKTSGTITAGTVTYPNADGTANQVLKTDGLGTLAWSTPSSGASGTTNYLSKFTGTTTLGNSLVYDDGTNVGVGTSTPSSLFQIGGETTSDLNLKFDRVLNQSAALKIGYRNYQWRMKTETDSGTLNPLNFSYYNSVTNTDVTRLTITNSGIYIPNNLEVVGSTTLQGDVNLNSSLSVNNDQFSVDALTNKVGVLTGSPSSMFQVGGNGDFDNPLRYDYGNSIGTLKFGYRQYEFRMKTVTDSGILTNLIYSYYNSSNDTDVESMRISNSGLVTLNSLKISGGSPGAGKVLTSDASGLTSWSTPSVASSSDFVDLTTAQTIAGAKTFSADIKVGTLEIKASAENQSTLIGTGVTSSTGINITAIGFMALNGNTGIDNTAIGSNTMRNSGATSGNTAIGEGAGGDNGGNTGGNNTFIGKGAVLNYVSTSISNATAIGNGSLVAASNSIQLGNTSITNVKTSGTITAGVVTYPNTHNSTAGQVLITDASGVANWGSAAATVREVADEFSAASSQTSFTLTQTPSANSKVKMYINGIRISNTAYSVSGATLTYTEANNGSYTLTASDRVQFDYFY
jgi:hypothetical protein